MKRFLLLVVLLFFVPMVLADVAIAPGWRDGEANSVFTSDDCSITIYDSANTTVFSDSPMMIHEVDGLPKGFYLLKSDCGNGVFEVYEKSWLEKFFGWFSKQWSDLLKLLF